MIAWENPMSSEASPRPSLSKLPFPFSFLSYILFVYLFLYVGHVCVWVHVPQHTCGGRSRSCWHWLLSPSITQVIKLGNRYLYFTHRTIFTITFFISTTKTNKLTNKKEEEGALAIGDRGWEQAKTGVVSPSSPPHFFFNCGVVSEWQLLSQTFWSRKLRTAETVFC